MISNLNIGLNDNEYLILGILCGLDGKIKPQSAQRIREEREEKG